MSASIITENLKVTEGQEILVNNQMPRLNAKKVYRALWVEDPDGVEKCLLFKSKDLNEDREVEAEGLSLKPGHYCRITQKGRTFLLLKFVRWEGETVVVKIPQSVYAAAEKRAINNPEDVPKKGFIKNV
jgi:hypothetical protein